MIYIKWKNKIKNFALCQNCTIHIFYQDHAINLFIVIQKLPSTCKLILHLKQNKESVIYIPWQMFFLKKKKIILYFQKLLSYINIVLKMTV